MADGEEVVWMRAVEDIAKIEEIEFGIGKSVIGGDVYEATYWYSAKKTGEGKVTSYVTEFTAENGSATLTKKPESSLNSNMRRIRCTLS